MARLIIYPALVLTAIFVWSAIFSKSSPKDVLPDVTLSKGDDEKPQIADYGEENDPSIKVVIKALLGLPIYRQLLVFSFTQPCFAQSFSSGPRCSSLTSDLTFLIQYYNQRFFVSRSTRYSFDRLVHDNYAKNGDRARTMWLMLVCLVISLAGIALMSSLEAQL